MRLKIIFFILTSFIIIFLGNIYNKRQILKEKIGQMILVGFKGKEVPDYLKAQLKDNIIGGIILFDYDVTSKSFDRNIENPKQVKSLISDLQNNAKTPLFISVDQEGGLINRLKPEYGFPKTLSAKVLGEKDDAKLTYENAKVIAETLKSLGFNLNFAPVVDVNTNPENPVIAGKERSYSSNPYKVAEHSEQVIKAHKDLDILTALKHFPGHGSSSSDSHLGFVDVSETWNEKELIPYKELINTGKVEIVMTAHVFNKKLDEKYPATLSKKSLSKLRKDFAYDGIIISDDLQMNAIAKHYSIEEAIPLMVNAGVDIFCIGNNLEIDENIVPKVIDIVMEKIFSGEISEEQIETSYNKIISLKKKYKIIR